MTLETALITAVSALSSVLSVISKLLWDRIKIVEVKADACEQHRTKMQDEIETLKEGRGEASAILTAVAACPAEKCPTKVLVPKGRPARYSGGEPTSNPQPA